MKILLDENLPVKLKFRLTGHDVCTVRDMKWEGYKNGHLLKTAVENGFTCLITTDKNLQFQQNIPQFGISVVILDILLLKWSYIEPLIEKLLDTLNAVKTGCVYSIK